MEDLLGGLLDGFEAVVAFLFDAAAAEREETTTRFGETEGREGEEDVTFLSGVEGGEFLEAVDLAVVEIASFSCCCCCCRLFEKGENAPPVVVAVVPARCKGAFDEVAPPPPAALDESCL